MTDPIEQLRSFGQDLRDSVPSGRSHVVAARAIGRARTPRRHRSWVVTAATLGMFVIANVAAAAVADSSAPGDTFYGVDRAYEWVSDTLGLTQDHTSERLAEAETLLGRSDPGGALDLVASETNDETVTMVAQSLQSSALADEDLKMMVMALVTDARKIGEAARSGDKRAKEEAKALLMTLIVDVPTPNQGQNPPGQQPGFDPGQGNNGTNGNPGTNQGNNGTNGNPGTNQGNNGNQGTNQGNQGTNGNPGTNQGNPGTNQGNPGTNQGNQGNHGKPGG